MNETKLTKKMHEIDKTLAALGIVAVGKFMLDLASSYVGKH